MCLVDEGSLTSTILPVLPQTHTSTLHILSAEIRTTYGISQQNTHGMRLFVLHRGLGNFAVNSNKPAGMSLYVRSLIYVYITDVSGVHITSHAPGNEMSCQF